MIYLLCNIKPEIFFVIGQFSRHNADPKIKYPKITKQVIWYLKDIIHLGIIYDRITKIKKSQLFYRLVSYVNNNYTSNLEDYKSMIKHCFFINEKVIS